MVSALALTFFGGWREAGFFKIGSWRAWLICLPPLAVPLILLFVTGIVVVDPLQVLMLVVFVLMVGFAEEALCRGLMVRAFLSHGPMRAAIISSLIFGAMHLINAFYGMNLGMAALYAVYAALVGFGFAAPYIRSGGALWPLIMVHGLYDLLGKLGHNWGAQAVPTSSNEAIFRLGMAILICVYGVWLLRRGATEKTTAAIAQKPGQPPAPSGLRMPGAPRPT